MENEYIQKITLRKMFSFFKTYWKYFTSAFACLFLILSLLCVFAIPTKYKSVLSFEYGRLNSSNVREPHVIGTTSLFSDFESVLKLDTFTGEIFDSLDEGFKNKGIDYFRKGITFPSFSASNLTPLYTIEFEYDVKGFSTTVASLYAEKGIAKLLDQGNTFKYTIIKPGSPTKETSKSSVLRKTGLVGLSLFASILLVLLFIVAYFAYFCPIIFIDKEKYPGCVFSFADEKGVEKYLTKSNIFVGTFKNAIKELEKKNHPIDLDKKQFFESFKKKNNLEEFLNKNNKLNKTICILVSLTKTNEYKLLNTISSLKDFNITIVVFK